MSGAPLPSTDVSYYPCESCGTPQSVAVVTLEFGKPPVSVDRRPCDRCGGVLSSWPVGLTEKLERLVAENP